MTVSNPSPERLRTQARGGEGRPSVAEAGVGVATSKASVWLPPPDQPSAGHPPHHALAFASARGRDKKSRGIFGATRQSACSHSAAPRHNVSRCSGRKKPKWPILAAPASAGAMLAISGLVAVNPEHNSSTAGRVAHGSSVMHRARSVPRKLAKFFSAGSAGSSNR